MDTQNGPTVPAPTYTARETLDGLPSYSAVPDLETGRSPSTAQQPPAYSSKWPSQPQTTVETMEISQRWRRPSKRRQNTVACCMLVVFLIAVVFIIGTIAAAAVRAKAGAEHEN